jgi:hypothetical protein
LMIASTFFIVTLLSLGIIIVIQGIVPSLSRTRPCLVMFA